MMKRNIIILAAGIILSFSAYAFVQSAEKVAIITIYKDRGSLFIKDRSVLPRTKYYEVNKIDNKNYTLIYKGNKPRVLYLDEKPIYITPGDKVHLNFSYISELGRERDTVIATGDNAANYTYYPILLLDSKERRKAIGMSYPNPADSKYAKIIPSLYDDLMRYNALSWKHINALLVAGNYNNDIIRQMELDTYAISMFSHRFFEEKLLNTNSIQLKDFAKKLERDFALRNINPADTIFSPNIEGAISLYFGHLEEVKFAGVKSDSELLALISYVKNYPNQFVREYLLYFLMQNFGAKLSADYHAKIKPDLDKIGNPIIIAALKNGAKKKDADSWMEFR